MNAINLKLVLSLATQAVPIIHALQALDQAVKEQTPTDQHAKDFLAALDDLIAAVLKAL